MVSLRLAEPRDAAAIAAIYAPHVERGYASFEEVAPDAAEMARRLAATLAHAPWLVAEADGEVVGYAYASRHHARAAYRWSVDVAVYVGAGRQRGGVGRRLYGALLPLLRLQGFRAAHAGISLPNPASVALHEGLGFRPVGVYEKVGFKLGAWRDVGWWQLELGARTGPPAEPLTLAEARALPAWAAALGAA